MAIDIKRGTDGNDTIAGTSGDEALLGGKGDDVLIGGAGNDILMGGEGADRFVFGRGHGEDAIWDFDSGDVIDLSGFDGRVTWDALSGKFTEGYNILFGSYVEIDLTDWGGGKIQVYGVESADDLTEDMFVLPVTPVTETGGDDSDSFHGNWGDDTLEGGGGNDYLYGWQGDDTLKGGAGNDFIVGGQGDDTIEGGAGNDRLYGDGLGKDDRYADGTRTGETDNDTFVFAPGHGNDWIMDFEPDGDTIDLSGFSQRIAWSDVRNSMTATDEGVRIDLSQWGGGTVTLRGIDSPDELTEDMFVLPVTPVTLTGGDGGDLFHGNWGDDSLEGRGGNDSLFGNQGDDTLKGGAGNDAVVGGQGDDTIVGGTGNDKLWGDGIHFDGHKASLPPTGETGNDTFVFAPGHGDDTIFDFEPDADTIDLSGFSRGIAWFDLRNSMTATDDGLKIDLSQWGGGTVTLRGIDSPDELTEDMFVLADASVTLTGTDGADRLRGGAGNDTLSGGDGNDILHGYQGDDTLEGGAGDDSIFGYEGDDIIVGGAGDDNLFGDGVYGDDVHTDGTPTGETDNDTFVFAPGGGNDTIYDFTDGEDAIDLTAFTGIAGFADIDARQDGNNVVIEFSGNNSITLQNFLLSDLDETDFVFYETPSDGG